MTTPGYRAVSGKPFEKTTLPTRAINKSPSFFKENRRPVYVATRVLLESKHFHHHQVQICSIIGSVALAHLQILAQREGPCTFPVILVTIWSMKVYMVLSRDVTFLSQQGLPLFYHTFNVDVTICNPGHCAYSWTTFPFCSQGGFPPMQMCGIGEIVTIFLNIYRSNIDDVCTHSVLTLSGPLTDLSLSQIPFTPL